MKSLADQIPNPAMATPDADERARQDFAFTFRNYVTGELMPSVHQLYATKIEPAFRRAHGRPPESAREIREAVTADSYFSFYASARRTSQELIWNGVTDVVERQLPQLIENAKAAGGAGGTLTLNPATPIPPYAVSLDIHCMPGGYAAESAADDVAAGAVYDRGVYLYLSGLAGPRNDAVGQLSAAFLKSRFPDFHPKAILDLGCGVGHATLPYVDAYPEAEVTGLDVGAGLLRYAHARAESWGKKAHFVQANAETTGLPDASFDLVMSHILLHETSTKALPAIFRECRRLLKPGGLMLHIDQPSFRHANPFQRFMQENETYYNNEPFWRTFRSTDLPAAAEAAGFAREHIATEILTSALVRQAQNNEKVADESPEAKARGFEALLAWA